MRGAVVEIDRALLLLLDKGQLKLVYHMAHTCGSEIHIHFSL